MLVKDVVCGMQVEEGTRQIEYRGEKYSFCSQQCHDRFQSNPRLYIGVPGQQAPRHAGLEVMKRRRMRLSQPLSSSQAEMLAESLQAMRGVLSVSIEDDRVSIEYDLLLVTAEQLEQKLAEIGIQLGTGWSDRLLRTVTHYEEGCEIGNLEVDPKQTGHKH